MTRGAGNKTTRLGLNWSKIGQRKRWFFWATTNNENIPRRARAPHRCWGGYRGNFVFNVCYETNKNCKYWRRRNEKIFRKMVEVEVPVLVKKNMAAIFSMQRVEKWKWDWSKIDSLRLGEEDGEKRSKQSWRKKMLKNENVNQPRDMRETNETSCMNVVCTPSNKLLFYDGNTRYNAHYLKLRSFW